MKSHFLSMTLLVTGLQLSTTAQTQVRQAGAGMPVYQSEAFTVFHNRVEQNGFTATAVSPYEMNADYKSPDADKYTPDATWKKTLNTDAFPQYRSDYLISDAIYNLSLEEMIRAVEPDSTFRTGKEWSGVWTRDISYSIILSMAHLQPKVAINSLMRKVNGNKRIIQDTGTGGAWPNSTDRMIWATAAWEVYKATGDRQWLEQAYTIIRNSIEDDLLTIYNPVTGLVKGESSFLDWREQTYPLWMQPADIFESECLGTNAVHYQANKVLADMADLLHEVAVAQKHRQIAHNIKEGINRYLWMADKNTYAQYLYGRNFKIVSPRSEALGEALCVIFGIAGKEQAEKLVANTPVTPYGIPCIWPQIPNIPPYHNNGIWPFVQSFWLWAGASVHNQQSVMESIGAIYRPAAMFLTNKENFVAENGDLSGTQINSSIMLWSLSGNLSLVHKVLFGIRFEPGHLAFRPFVPEALKGNRSLTNFKYRHAVLDIEMTGFGNTIKSMTLDGKDLTNHTIPGNLEGRHAVTIHLDSQPAPPAITNRVPVVFSPEAPIVQLTGETASWTPVKGAVAYIILVNGVAFDTITSTHYNLQQVSRQAPTPHLQVIAINGDGIGSFASEPVVYLASGNGNLHIVQAETIAPKAEHPYTGASEGGFIEISKNVNTTVSFPVTVETAGLYAIDFRYSNGNGPTNTENKCAIRTLKVDNRAVNAIIFPQRGKEEWSAWGFSNALTAYLTKGNHTITLSFEPANENMHGEINQAMIDYMRVLLLKEGN